MSAERAVVYPGTQSLVHVLYLLANEEDSSDAVRITALRQLHERVGPSSARAQATVALREFELSQLATSRVSWTSSLPTVHRHLENARRKTGGASVASSASDAGVLDDDYVALWD
jgi:hypothetical protein